MKTNNQITMESSEKLSFNVVLTISEIAKVARHSGLKEETILAIRSQLDLIAKYLNVSENQAIIFISVFVQSFRNYNTDLNDIINFLDYDIIDSINLKPDFEALFQKRLLVKQEEFRRKLRKSDLSEINFNVPSFVSECIYSNVPISIKKLELLDVYEFVAKVSSYIEKCCNDEIDTSELFERVLRLEKRSEHLEIVKKHASKMKIGDRTLLYEIVDDHVNGVPTSVDKTLKDIYDNNRVRLIKFRELSEKSNILFELDYVTLGESRFANDFILNLTSTAIELIFQEDAVLFSQNKKLKNLIYNNDIAKKELYYDSELEKQIDFIQNSLIEENFRNLQERLTQQKLSKGIAAIFFGSPGTGKTETALQIAKLTGRDILKVDISQSKSMWFGESEKKIKEIFDTYSRILKTSEKTPILLFNEADALFSKRKESNQSNVSSTENAMQNIILEELENFEGILIATTNLEGNFDPAYERRFLFKVKFDTPTADVKSRIWQNKLNWIEPDFAQKLSKEFSFSGGEIDNIVKKVAMQEVLTGKRPDVNEIYGYCKSEKMLTSKRESIKVGYV